jgi:hypothetical protein
MDDMMNMRKAMTMTIRKFLLLTLYNLVCFLLFRTDYLILCVKEFEFFPT